MQIDQATIDALPRHTADPRVAYVETLDPDTITKLIEEGVLAGALFRKYVPKKELASHATPSLTRGFRSASEYFTSGLFSQEGENVYKNGKGLAVMRFASYDGQGIFPFTNDYESRSRNFNEFVGGNWLTNLMNKLSAFNPKKMGESGFHVFQADKNTIYHGYSPKWHNHKFRNTHITLSDTPGLQWLPSYVDQKDVDENLLKYEHLTQTVDAGDLFISGPEIVHRTNNQIYEHGQLAIVGGPRIVGEYAND